MTRTRTLLAAAALLLSAAAVNCAKSGSDVGTARLALTVPGGYTINTVTYTVKQGATVLLGPATFDVSDPNAAPSLDIALPPSVGDTITLRAVATNGHVFEGTGGPFNIVSGQTALVNVTLTDTLGTPADAPGKVVVTGTIVPNNLPPIIASVVIAPSQTSVGANIAVSVVASDPDAGDTLTYLWSSDSASGAFASATSATTTYSGTAAGTQNLSIKVTDSHGSSVTVSLLPVNLIGAPTGAAGTGAAGTGEAGTGAAGTGVAGTGVAGTGVAGPSALEIAITALQTEDQNAFTATHGEDPSSGDAIPIGWGPETLPSPEQRVAANALLRRIAFLLPNSARNAANTGPYAPEDVNVLNALLTLNASPIDLLTATNLAPAAGSAWDAFKAGVVADTFAPAGPFYLHGVPAGSSEAAFGTYISNNSPDPEGVVGLVANIVKAALLHGLEAELHAY